VLISSAANATVAGTMTDTPSSQHRSGIVAVALLLVLLGVLALLSARRAPTTTGPSTAPSPGVVRTNAVDFDRFSSFWERSPDGERLHVSLRLRTTGTAELPCFVFVLARNERSSPRAWAIWPPQPPGPVVTFGGHFLGSDPGKGQALTLTERWERISAILPHTAGRPPYDTVLVYVLGKNGNTLLARPFRL
jgi:hypothetical protein